jgi:hypothetical protein
MESGPTSSDLMSVYECSQEAAYHSDTVMWEVTAIIWGANTLLLGFILEALEDPRALKIIIPISIIGMILTAFVARVCAVATVAKKAGFGICREMEKTFPERFRLHTTIDKDYPKGMGRTWVYGISSAFGIVWLIVLFYAAWLLLCHT